MNQGLRLTCFKSYDPYFGFKVVSIGQRVTAYEQSNGLTRLETDNGQLLGTIYSGDLFNYFSRG